MGPPRVEHTGLVGPAPTSAAAPEPPGASPAMPKVRRARGSAAGADRALPLPEQLLRDAAPRARARRGRAGEEEEEDEEQGCQGYVDARLSRRILQQARRQQEELEAEHGPGAPAAPRHRSRALGETPPPPSPVPPRDPSSGIWAQARVWSPQVRR